MAGKYDDRLKDYVQVNERIIAFYAKYPNGSIQSEITHLDEKLVVVKAWAYRDADDKRPGMGHSSLGIPGSTPYTRGSEVENAETSAWGRAIAALGFNVNRAVASREEIENKQEEVPTPQNGSNREPRASTEGQDADAMLLKTTRVSLIKKAKERLGDRGGMEWLRGATTALKKTSDQLTLAELLDLSEQLSRCTKPEEITPTEDSDVPF